MAYQGDLRTWLASLQAELDGLQQQAGPAGPAGPQGLPGPKGDTGAQGLPGPKGDTGAQGTAGATGAAGQPGAQGPIGNTGPTGSTGAQGLKGDTGLTGPAGPTGATGAQGPAGATGQAGLAGATGPQGPAGNTGPQGATGAQGPAGPANKSDIGPFVLLGSAVLTTATQAKLGASSADAVPVPMPFAGSIVGVALRASADIGAAGVSLKAEVYKNGVATGVICTITGSAGSDLKATGTGSIAFIVGDELDLRLTRVGTLATLNAYGWIWVQV